MIPDVRASDIEPYTGLRYLSKLFKVMGVVIALLLVFNNRIAKVAPVETAEMDAGRMPPSIP